MGVKLVGLDIRLDFRFGWIGHLVGLGLQGWYLG